MEFVFSALRGKELEAPEASQGARFTTDLKELAHVSKWLKQAGWNIAASEMRYVAKNPVELGEKDRGQVVEFLHALGDHDDVHHVFAGLK